MKHHFFTLFCILATTLFACSGQKTSAPETDTPAGTQTFIYKDSSQHVILTLSLELPQGSDSASMLMRDSLIADFMNNASQPGFGGEDSEVTPPYTGDKSDYQALVDYYGKAAYETLLTMAKNDYEERMKYLEEDTTMALEDKKRIMDDVPQWAFELVTKKTIEAERFIVYNSQVYCYYGGAHGGITGSGSLTFSKDTGEKINRFIKSDAAKAMQPLIRKGLLSYYRDAGDPISDRELSERLQIEGSIIPLPHQAASPNAAGDSLIFIYGQYEIAAYADGMPSFSLAVKDLMPHLTQEAEKLLLTQQDK